MSSKVLFIGLLMTALAASGVGAQTRQDPPSRQGRIPFPQAGSLSTIGVRLSDVTSENMKALKLPRAEGAVVESVNPDSPAATTGVHEKDVIVVFDGERVRSASHLTRLVHETPAGREVVMAVMRDGRRTELRITPVAGDAGWFDPRFGDLINSQEIRRKMEEAGRELGRRFPEAMEGMALPGRGRLGVNVQPLSADLAAYFGVKAGVLVSGVTPDSPAAKAGLQAGDVITAVNGKPVASPGELVGALPGVDGTHDVTLTVVRDKKEMTVKATVGSASPTGVRI
jgi:serine protease Do